METLTLVSVSVIRDKSPAKGAFAACEMAGPESTANPGEDRAASKAQLTIIGLRIGFGDQNPREKILIFMFFCLPLVGSRGGARA